MFKRIITVNMVVIMLMTGVASARVESISINGSLVKTDVAPMVVDGWFVVPLSAVGRHVGAEVVWDAEGRLVNMVYLDKIIVIKINDSIAVVNGKQRKMLVPAIIVRGRTMVTAGFMAECLNAATDWDYHTTTVLFEYH